MLHVTFWGKIQNEKTFSETHMGEKNPRYFFQIISIHFHIVWYQYTRFPVKHIQANLSSYKVIKVYRTWF